MKRSKFRGQFLLSRLVPSMFQRRLILVGSGALVAAVVLIVQMARLTIVEGAVWRGRAEAALVHRRLIPTARGRILDRRMRVLAADRPSDDVCVRYAVLTGDWAYTRARRDAYKANKTHWVQFHEQDRQVLIEQYQRPYDQQVEKLWQTLCREGGIDRHELEQRKATIVRRVKQIASTVWDRRLQLRMEEEGEPISLIEVAQPISEQTAAHPLLKGVDHLALIRFQSLIAAAADDPGMAVWRQVSVEPSRSRYYPLQNMTLLVERNTLPGPLRRDTPIEVAVNGVGTHFIGALRNVWKEDVQRRPFRRPDGGTAGAGMDLGGYLPGDAVGWWGMEKSQEDRLRGVRGQVVRHLDTDQQQRIEPLGGGDVVLTVDIQLQARLQAIMAPAFGLMRVQPWHHDGPRPDPLEPQPGQTLNGAAVVLDVQQSQVLAAVSVPGFSLQQLRDDPGSVWRDHENQPFLNRTVSRPYQPGSTVKPLVLAAAMTDGKISGGETIECNGHLDPNHNDRYRCWIYKSFNSTHGPLAGREAIARSCNIFFYTLGRRLSGGLVGWYDRFGLGRSTGCGLAEEVRGDLPKLGAQGYGSVVNLSVADAIFMGIGQGPIRWTPLQAAGAYAALARGGYAISPNLVMLGDRVEGQDGYDLELDPRGVEAAMGGLEDAVTKPYGSVHSLTLLRHEPVFNIESVRIFAKSGTAQGVPLWLDEDRDGRFNREVDRIVRRGDHAWTLCLVQRPGSPRPDFVVAVVVEYGGSGGAVAAPIVNQILHAMRAEGYL